MKRLIGLALATVVWAAPAAHAQQQVLPGNRIGTSSWQATSNSNPLPVTTSASGINTYSTTSIGLVPASSATDIWCIKGSATKTVVLSGIRISGVASANVNVHVVIIKRSTANSGGTATQPTIVPHDSSDAAATAVVNAYTANPTVGATVGTLRSQYITLSGNSSPNIFLVPLLYNFAAYGGQYPTLRGTAESVCVNLNGTSVSSGSLDIDAEWTER